MATIDTKTIANTKIKFRFAEPYASEASNIQMGVNLPGVYRGALIESDSPVSQKIYINKESGDTDSIILHRSSSDGICTVVRETSSVELDLGSAWPISSDTTLYVYMDIDYDHVPQTSGNFSVVDSVGDIPADAVMLAHILIPSGASNIEQVYIKTDGSKRDKTIPKKGLLVQKQATISADTGATGFEITDRVCYLGDTSLPKSRISLRSASPYPNIQVPLMGSDGGQICAGSWYDVEGGTVLSISDMDEDGCYDNPWISMSFTDTVDNDYDNAFSVLYYAYVPFDEFEVVDQRTGFISSHANEMYVKDISGTPDDLSKGSLDTQLSSILSLINSRIRKYHPDVSSSSWSLLWRSNDVEDDADVDINTLSLYYCSKGFLFAQGGYITGSYSSGNMVVPSGSSTGNVTAISFANGSFINRWKNVTALPATLDLLDAGDWDSSESHTNSDIIYNILARSIGFDEYATVTMDGTYNAGSNPKYIEILDAAIGNLHVYFGGTTTSTGGIIITFGAKWSEGTNKWIKSHTTSFDAYMFAVGGLGIRIFRKDKDDADYSGGWYGTDWTNEFIITDEIRSGKVVEEVVVPFKIVMSEKYVLLFEDLSEVGPTIKESVNFKIKRDAVPTTFTWSPLSGEKALLSKTVVSVDDSSLQVSGILDLTDQTYPAPLTRLNMHNKGGSGTLDPFESTNKIRVQSASIPSYRTIGYSIGVRGSANNEGAWTIISWTTGSDSGINYVEFTVDTKNGMHNVTTEAYSAGQYAYILTTDKNGTEVTAYHSIQIED